MRAIDCRTLSCCTVRHDRRHLREKQHRNARIGCLCHCQKLAIRCFVPRLACCYRSTFIFQTPHYNGRQNGSSRRSNALFMFPEKYNLGIVAVRMNRHSLDKHITLTKKWRTSFTLRLLRCTGVKIILGSMRRRCPRASTRLA